MKYAFLLIGTTLCLFGKAQMTDSVYAAGLHTIKLYPALNQLGYPILPLGSSDKLELQFDDLDGDVKNYSYTLVLCNADWTPAAVSPFDYIKGSSQVRIGDYRYSSIALTHYTHYKAAIPDPNCIPIHSGNYLLEVFVDGDPSKLAFTRRFLITDEKTTIQAQLLQPLNYELARTHQRIPFTVNANGLNPSNPLEQIKVVILQNDRWDNVVQDIKPTFFSNNKLEYNDNDGILFPGGPEWRWVDLQSFRYQSDRIKSAIYGKASTDIFVKPDGDRSHQVYYFYKDYNGHYFIQTTESINPWWQTDYARTWFSFVPPGNSPFPDKDVYLFGELTGYALNDSTRMSFNPAKGRYEVSMLLKQGYYDYTYVTTDRNDPDRKLSFDLTEGNHIETENDYRILVYFRPLGGRADELVGMYPFNSLNGK